jgi:hypothetical protein
VVSITGYIILAVLPPIHVLHFWELITSNGFNSTYAFELISHLLLAPHLQNTIQYVHLSASFTPFACFTPALRKRCEASKTSFPQFRYFDDLVSKTSNINIEYRKIQPEKKILWTE